jgi:hypothetical protein
LPHGFAETDAIMIKINLLPTEKRRAERTPFPRLILIVSTAGVAAGVTVIILFILLRIADTNAQIAENKTTLQRLQPQVAEFERLTKTHNDLVTKVREIDSLITRDVPDGWWRAVNALWDEIHKNPKIWIDDLRVLDEKATVTEIKRIDPDDRTAASPYGITMKCHVAGDEVAEMTRFRNDLKSNPVLQELLTHINFNVDWKVEEEKDFEEKQSIAFQVSMFALNPPPKKRALAAGPGPAPDGRPAPPPAGVAK